MVAILALLFIRFRQLLASMHSDQHKNYQAPSDSTTMTEALILASLRILQSMTAGRTAQIPSVRIETAETKNPIEGPQWSA